MRFLHRPLLPASIKVDNLSQSLTTNVTETAGEARDGGRGRGAFSLVLPPGRGGLILPHITGDTNSRCYRREVELGLDGLGTSLLPRFGLLLVREPSKSRVPETIPPSLQSCPLLATPLTRALQLTYLSLAEVVCPWSAHLPDGNKPRPQTAPPGPGAMGISLSAVFTVWALAPPNCSWVHCQDGEGVGL